MKASPRILRALPFVLFAVTLACTQTPRMDEANETDYIRMLREEFFKTHPDGKYNEHIARGEVVRGMDFLEVLASWGNPGKREKPTPRVEYWLYLEEDPDTDDWVKYKFIFRDNVLDDWELTRHIAQGGLEQTLERTSPVLTKGSGVGTASGGSPKKK